MSEKKKIIGGLAWVYSERLLAQGVTLAVTIVLARILDPEHYGIIAIVSTIIAIMSVFVNAGFGKALIQDKNADKDSFTSCFYFSLFFGFLLYAALFFSAPLFSLIFKNYDNLTSIVRVMGLQLPLAGINSVQHAYLEKKFLFKKFFFITLSGTLLSAVVGIVLAYCGFGVWSLVAQHLTNVIIDTILLFAFLDWKPIGKISFLDIKRILPFSIKLFFNDLTNEFYNEARPLLIGGLFDSSTLSFYNRGEQVPKLAIGSVNTSLTKVLYPSFSEIQDEREKMRDLLRKSIKTEVFVLFPILIGLFLVSDEFVFVLFSEKWMNSVIFLQLFCFSYLFTPLYTSILQIYKAVGRPDINLKLSIIKKAVGISLLLIALFVFKSVLAIAISFVIECFFNWAATMMPCKMVLDYSFKDQLKDIYKSVLSVAIMGLVVFSFGFLPIHSKIIMLICKIAIGSITYFLLCYLLKEETLLQILKLKKKTDEKSIDC